MSETFLCAHRGLHRGVHTDRPRGDTGSGPRQILCLQVGSTCEGLHGSQTPLAVREAVRPGAEEPVLWPWTWGVTGPPPFPLAGLQPLCLGTLLMVPTKDRMTLFCKVCNTAHGTDSASYKHRPLLRSVSNDKVSLPSGLGVREPSPGGKGEGTHPSRVGGQRPGLTPGPATRGKQMHSGLSPPLQRDPST